MHASHMKLYSFLLHLRSKTQYGSYIPMSLCNRTIISILTPTFDGKVCRYMAIIAMLLCVLLDLTGLELLLLTYIITMHLCCIIFHSHVKLLFSVVIPTVVSIRALDQFYDQLSACLYESASSCIPTISCSLNSTRLAGWNDSAKLFKSHANICTRFGVKLIGHLHAGVIAQIKKAAKSRFKYEVCRLKRHQLYIRRKKMTEAFTA